MTQHAILDQQELIARHQRVTEAGRDTRDRQTREAVVAEMAFHDARVPQLAEEVAAAAHAVLTASARTDDPGPGLLLSTRQARAQHAALVASLEGEVDLVVRLHASYLTAGGAVGSAEEQHLRGIRDRAVVAGVLLAPAGEAA